MNLKCSMLNKRSQSHDYVLYDSTYVTFWKRQIIGTEQIIGWQDLGGKGGSDLKKRI